MDFRVGALPKIRVLRRPDKSLRTLVERAPEAEAFADHLMEKSKPALTWFYAIRRKGATGAVMVFTIWLLVHVMFGANGMVVYRQKRTELKALQTEIGTSQKENDAYNRQIKSLSTDPKAIEKEAREKLHYMRDWEVVLVSPAPVAPPSPNVKAAGK